MSSFYESMPRHVADAFKTRKRIFKRKKKCCNMCGKQLHRAEDKVVDHIVPASAITDYVALYDQTNWQVICFSCKKKKDLEDARNY